MLYYVILYNIYIYIYIYIYTITYVWPIMLVLFLPPLLAAVFSSAPASASARTWVAGLV